jgi:hypothetical protein
MLFAAVAACVFLTSASAASPLHDWSTGRHFLWAEWSPNPASPVVAIEVHAVVLGIPTVVFNVSVPLTAATTAYAAMQRAAEDPTALVFDERPIGGHPFIISFGPLPCTRERCWYLSVNGRNASSPVDEVQVTAGDVVRWDYLTL